MTKHILVSPTFAPLLSAKYNVRRIWEMGYVRRAMKKKDKELEKTSPEKKGGGKGMPLSLKSSHGGGRGQEGIFPFAHFAFPSSYGEKTQEILIPAAPAFPYRSTLSAACIYFPPFFRGKECAQQCVLNSLFFCRKKEICLPLKDKLGDTVSRKSPTFHPFY